MVDVDLIETKCNTKMCMWCMYVVNAMPLLDVLWGKCANDWTVGTIFINGQVINEGDVVIICV